MSIIGKNSQSTAFSAAVFRLDKCLVKQDSRWKRSQLAAREYSLPDGLTKPVLGHAVSETNNELQNE